MGKQTEYHKKRYLERKKKGICQRCPRKVEPGRISCAYHLEKDKAREKPYNRNTRLLKYHGLSVDEYQQLSEKQMKQCMICGGQWVEGQKWLAVDHDHKTGKIRGLLCSKCNTGLGLFNDDIRLLQNAIHYLEGNS